LKRRKWRTEVDYQIHSCEKTITHHTPRGSLDDGPVTPSAVISIRID
jgi:hypothetical protein